eukprot:gene10684-11820_t
MSSPLVFQDGAPKNGLTIDEILPMIGGFGKFQIILEIAFCIMVFPASMAILLPYFAQHDPGWRCTFNSTICKLDGTITSSNKNDFEKRCNMPRSEWQFTQPKDYSVATQFDLSCAMQPYNLLATSMVFIFWALGAVVLGWLADKYGRKLVLIPSTAAIVIIGFISAFSPNFAFYAVARVLVGFFIPGNIIQLFVLISEIGRKKPVVVARLIGGLACIAATLIPANDKKSDLIPLRVCFGIFGKLCITISFASIYIWSAELYPTVIRGAAMGYLQIAADLAQLWLLGSRNGSSVYTLCCLFIDGGMCHHLCFAPFETARNSIQTNC